MREGVPGRGLQRCGDREPTVVPEGPENTGDMGLRPAVGEGAEAWSCGSRGHGDLIGCDARGFEVEGGLWDRRTE